MYNFKMNEKWMITICACLAVWVCLDMGKDRSYANNLAVPIYKVILQSVYVDGEVSEEIVFKEINSKEDVFLLYKDWELIGHSDREIVFRKEINDISPLLKANGYFGVTEDGVLSIFNGRPEEADVIHSFFQINVEMLEVKKQNELGQGIRVNDKKQYEAVLETFKPYMEN